MKRGYQKPQYDIGAIVRSELEWIWANTSLSVHQKRMLQAIADCRTRALGAHKLACTECGNVQIAYNSCRNRNCPKCQRAERKKWIAAREEELLPVPYFHLVFTLPGALNPLCLKYPKVMYSCLFQATWYTVKKLAADPKWIGGQTGMTAVLHTCLARRILTNSREQAGGSNLQLHPHLHCIVPGGALTKSGIWKPARSNGRYLFNREVMGLIFRARFVKLLRKTIQRGSIPQNTIPPGLFKQLFQKQWITYAKRPLLGPKQVIEYLGRYTHKIAITNHRITQLSKETVSFRWKDYRKKGKQKVMTLTKQEFIRRLAMHIIPHKFVRIRHYGFLANRNKTVLLPICQAVLNVQPTPEKVVPKVVVDHRQQPHFCPCCEKITAHYILDIIPPIRAGPAGMPNCPSPKNQTTVSGS